MKAHPQMLGVQKELSLLIFRLLDFRNYRFDELIFVLIYFSIFKIKFKHFKPIFQTLKKIVGGGYQNLCGLNTKCLRLVTSTCLMQEYIESHSLFYWIYWIVPEQANSAREPISEVRIPNSDYCLLDTWNTSTRTQRLLTSPPMPLTGN